MNAPIIQLIHTQLDAVYSADAVAPPSAAVPRRRWRLGPGRAIPYGRAIGPILLLLLWFGASALGLIDPRILPAPWTVVQAALDLISDGRLQDNLETSAIRAGQGFAYGVLGGVVVALLAGLTRFGEYTLDGLVEVKRAIPTLALIPLLMLWLGIGETMKVTIIALGVFAPVYINTFAGLRGIDSKYVELAETLKVSHWSFLRHVVLPGALPGFLLGLRFGVNAAWLTLVVVEQLNATSGIGYMIDLARTYGQTEIVLVGICVYALLGLTSDGIVRLIQRRVLSWRRTLAD